MRPAILATGLCIFFGARWAPAEEPGAQEAPIEITLSGQAIESPRLKYRLLPTEPELHRGNAAPILLRFPWDETRYFAEVVPTFEKWTTLPLDDPAWQESHGVVSDYFFGQMRRAALRRDAEWEHPIGEGPGFDEILLPDVQGARTFFRDGLVGKTRYHLSRGELVPARETILVALAIFRHYARMPFLVTQLNSAANTRAILSSIDEMIGRPNSPNLYWALTALPRPYFDTRPSVETLEPGLSIDIPELADLGRVQTADQWRGVAERLITKLDDAGKQQHQTPKVVDRELWLARARDTATRWGGETVDSAANVSDDEALVRWFAWQYVGRMQQIVADMSLPAHLAIGALDAADKVAERDCALLGLNDHSAPDVVMLKMGDCILSLSAIDRKIAMLRVVESIRDFLPAHAGKLPAKLADLGALCPAIDPTSNRPFEWTVAGNVGRLSAPSTRVTKEPPWTTFEYVLRVR